MLGTPLGIAQYLPQGLHVNDLAAPTKINAPKLGMRLLFIDLLPFTLNCYCQYTARVLRVLATSHIFREVSPDVFAHNRISSLLDTGKSLEEILQEYANYLSNILVRKLTPMPQPKLKARQHQRDFGSSRACVSLLTSPIGHAHELTLFYSADEGMKSSAYMPETLFDPKYTNSDEPNEVAFNLAYSTNLTTFAWFELPENAYILRRFGLAMNGGQQLFKDTQADPGNCCLSAL